MFDFCYHTKAWLFDFIFIKDIFTIIYENVSSLLSIVRKQKKIYLAKFAVPFNVILGLCATVD